MSGWSGVQPEVRAALLRALSEPEALLLAGLLTHRNLGTYSSLAALADTEWGELRKAASLNFGQIIRVKTEIKTIGEQIKAIGEERKGGAQRIGTLKDFKGACCSSPVSSKPQSMDGIHHSTQSLSARVLARSNPKTWNSPADPESSCQISTPTRTAPLAPCASPLGTAARAADRTWSPRNAANGTTHYKVAPDGSVADDGTPGWKEPWKRQVNGQLASLHAELATQKTKLKQQELHLARLAERDESVPQGAAPGGGSSVASDASVTAVLSRLQAELNSARMEIEELRATARGVESSANVGSQRDRVTMLAQYEELRGHDEELQGELVSLRATVQEQRRLLERVLQAGAHDRRGSSGGPANLRHVETTTAGSRRGARRGSVNESHLAVHHHAANSIAYGQGGHHPGMRRNTATIPLRRASASAQEKRETKLSGEASLEEAAQLDAVREGLTRLEEDADADLSTDRPPVYADEAKDQIWEAEGEAKGEDNSSTTSEFNKRLREQQWSRESAATVATNGVLDTLEDLIGIDLNPFDDLEEDEVARRPVTVV